MSCAVARKVKREVGAAALVHYESGQSDAAPATVGDVCSTIASPETGLETYVWQTRGGRAQAGSLNALAFGSSCVPFCYVFISSSEGTVMSSSTLTHSAQASASLSQRLVLAIGAGLLGAVLVYFAGFSHIEAVHNAAHDTRHSAAFPCH